MQVSGKLTQSVSHVYRSQVIQPRIGFADEAASVIAASTSIFFFKKFSTFPDVDLDLQTDYTSSTHKGFQQAMLDESVVVVTGASGFVGMLPIS